jgi:hypothetical protein
MPGPSLLGVEARLVASGASTTLGSILNASATALDALESAEGDCGAFDAAFMPAPFGGAEDDPPHSDWPAQPGNESATVVEKLLLLLRNMFD